jgi:signal transduction histidine kinase
MRGRWNSSLIVGAERSPLLGVAVAALAITACTLVIYPIKSAAPVDSLGVVYILAVLVVAANWGARLGVATALVSAAAFDFFHIPPVPSFGVEGSRNLVSLLAFVVAAVIAGAVAALTEQARSEAELRRSEAESRRRVVAAADEERRRVVRDLHDGAQQRLVHTVITLKLARRAQRERDPTAEALISEALDHAERATEELRELVHGILPSVLITGGLRAGAEALVSRVPVPVAIDVTAERMPAAIEATAYFIVAEALTNVVKHSRADTARVRAWVDRDVLHVEVRDDGVGGARLEGGTGLLGLADRVAAFDGRLRVDSPPGGGTLITATLPLRT